MNFDDQHFGGGTDNEEAAGPMHKDLPQLGGYVMSCSNSVSDSLPLLQLLDLLQTLIPTTDSLSADSDAHQLAKRRIDVDEDNR